MVKFKTFSEFKRNIKVGGKVTNVWHRAILGRDTETGKTIFGTQDRGSRIVSKVQSNSCAFATLKNGKVVDSWFYFPKASEVKVSNDDTLEVYEKNSDGKEVIMLSYQIEE